MADPNSFPATVFVTGATGFVGRTLVRRWVSGAGPQILRCLVRDKQRALRMGLPEESLVEGDLEDSEVLRSAVAGCDAVVHIAGLLTALRKREFFAVNQDGTRRLAEAVAASGNSATRFVYVSSLAAVGPSVDGIGTGVPPERARPCSTYGESKLAGEKELVGSGLTNWIVLRPPAVYGSGDRATRLLFDQARAPVTVVPLGRRPLSIIHVRDLVRAIESALLSGPAGAFVPVEGPDRTDTIDLVRKLGSACGRSPRMMPVPMLLARGAGMAADVVARVRGKAGFFNADKMREVGAPGWVADGRVAQDLLGFEPEVPLEGGLREVADEDGFSG